MRELVVEAAPAEAPRRKLGTFAGVFAPALIPIVATILHVRLAKVVATCGLVGTIGLILGVVVLAIPAGLSLASLGTRGDKGQGHRQAWLTDALGAPLGGALGLLLALGLTCVAAMDLMGLAQTLLREGAPAWVPGPPSASLARTVACALFAVVALLVALGPSLAVPLQMLALIATCAALLALVAGPAAAGSGAVVPPVEVDLGVGDARALGRGFILLFASVAGFAAAAASGTPLARPRRSLPNGLALAVGLGALIHAQVAVLLATRVPVEVLGSDTAVLAAAAFDPKVVVFAEWLASLAAALLCVTAAARLASATVLQAVLHPDFPGRRFVPVLAVGAVAVVGALSVTVTDIDGLAAAATTLLVGGYGMLSLSSALERWASPDFRPHYRVPGWISATGAATCALALVASGTAATAAVAVPFGLTYALLRRRRRAAESSPQTWAGVWSAVVRYGLKRLGTTRPSGNTSWQPNMLAVSIENPRPALIELSRMIVGGRGILTHYTLTDDGTNRAAVDEALQAKHDGLFARTQGTTTPLQTVPELARAFGFAGMETNALLLEWPREPRGTGPYVDMLKALVDLDVTIMCLRHDPARGFGRYRQVDLWWNGREHAGQLLLSLAHLLRQSDKWAGARLRVLVVAGRDWDDELARRSLDAAIAESRVDAEPVLLAPLSEEQTIGERIARESSAADLVVVGLPTLKRSTEADFVPKANQLVRQWGTTLLVRAARSDVSTRVVFRTKRVQAGDVSVAADFSLRMPSHPALAQVIARLEARLRSAIERFEADVTAPSAEEEQGFVATTADAIEQFRQLERRLARHSARRFVVRAHVDGAKGRFADDVVRQTEAFADVNQDGVWTARLRDGLSALRADIEAALAGLPEVVSVPTTAEDWLPRPGDPLLFRLRCFGVRVGLGLGSPAPVRRVPVRALAAYQLQGMLLDGLGDTAVALARRRFAALHLVRGFATDVERFFLGVLTELDLDASPTVALGSFRDGFRQEIDGLEEVSAKAIDRFGKAIAAPSAVLTEAMRGAGVALQADLEAPSVIFGYRWERSLARAAVRRRRTPEAYEQLVGLWARQHRALAAALLLDVGVLSMAIEARRATARLWERLSGEVEAGPRARLADATSIMAGLEDVLSAIEPPAPEAGAKRPSAELPALTEVSADADSQEAADSSAQSKRPSSDPPPPVAPEARQRLVVAADSLRATWDKPYRPDARAMIDPLIAGISRAAEKLPVTVSTLGDEALDAVRQGEPEPALTSVPARRLAQAFLEEVIAAPVQEALGAMPVAAAEVERKLVDACRLVAFELEHAAEGPGEGDERPDALVDPAGLVQTLNERMPRLAEASKDLDALTERLQDVLLHATSRALVTARQAIGAGGHVVAPELVGPQLVGKALSRARSGRQLIAGRLAARERAARIRAGRRGPAGSQRGRVDRLQRLREQLAADPEVFGRLPLAYRRLFGRVALDAADLAVGRHHQLVQARQIAERWQAGPGGPLAIIGAPRSGRTTMANLVAREIFGDRTVIRIAAPPGGTASPDAVNAATAAAVGAREGQSAEGALRTMPPGAMVIIDDLGRWIERRPGGLAALELWTRIWRRLGDRHFFAVTATEACWSYGELVGLSERFSGTVVTGPLAPSAIGELIEVRHRTSGLALEASASGGRRFSAAARTARAHARIHQLTGGNIGDAIDVWRRSIVRFFDDRVTVVVRSPPNMRVLNQLPVRWYAALVATVLHRALTVARAARILRLPRDHALGLLMDLERAGLLVSDRAGVFTLDTVLGPAVLAALSRQGLMP